MDMGCFELELNYLKSVISVSLQFKLLEFFCFF